MTAALFVDLPNFYSHLLESGIEEPRFLRDYFLYGLDFDLLANAIAGSFSGIWVFYSGRRFGPRENRIKENYLEDYIKRINSLRGVTARDVNIPSQQREITTYRCEKCGNEGVSQSESEKGIDASLTVHLFDTMDSWDTAYLLSGDADFVPAVASLRRRGKIVIGAGFPNVSAALVRECYDYVDLYQPFLREDVAAYAIFRPGGLAERWLTDEVRPKDEIPRPPDPLSSDAQLLVDWEGEVSYGQDPDMFTPTLKFGYKGLIDLSERTQFMRELRDKPGWNIASRQDPNRGWTIYISQRGVESVNRKIEEFITRMRESSKVTKCRRAQITAEYLYSPISDRYELVVDQSLL